MRGQESRWLILGGTGGIGRAVAVNALNNSEYVLCTGSSHGSVRRSRAEYRSITGINNKSFLVRRMKIKGWLSILHLYRWLQKLVLPDFVFVSYGPMIEKKLTSMLPRDWKRMNDHNLTVPGIVLSTLLGKMLKRGSGTIFLTGGTDTDSIRAFRRIAAYSAAKTGVSVLTVSAAETVREYCRSSGITEGGCNVRVVCICPGYIDTEYLSSEQKERFSRLAGKDGLSSPEQLADFVRKIAFDRKNYPNGTIINVKNYRE